MRKIFAFLLLLIAGSIQPAIGQMLANNSLIGQRNTVTLISAKNLDPLNRFIDVTFDPDAYSPEGDGVNASAFVLIFSQNGGDATAASISSVTKTSGAALVGGEGTIRINLNITGAPDGTETIEIKPATLGSVRDHLGRWISLTDGTDPQFLNREYDPLYRPGILYALDNSITPPGKAQRAVDNDLFVGLRADAALTELDGFHLFTHSTTFSPFNFGTGTFIGAFSGTVTIAPFQGGIASSGGFFDTNWDPLTDGIKFLQDDASLIAVVGNNAASNAILFGSRGSASGANFGHSRILSRNLSDQATGAVNINSSGNTTVASSVTNSEGVHMVSREASALTNQYLNGSFIDDGTTASSTLSNQDFYVWSENQDGTASTSNTVTEVMAVAWGSGLQDKITEINSRFQTWKTATEALIPSFSGKLYAVIGQSNADRSGLLSELTSGEAALYNNGPISMANGYDANVYVWWNDEWQLLEPGVNGVDKTGGGTWFGMIYPLMVMEAEKYPGENLFVIHQAVGGTGMRNTGGDPIWLPGGVPSSQYQKFIAEYNAAIAAMTSVSAHMKVFWFQGEADATRDTDSEEYGSINMAGKAAFSNSATLDAVNNATSMTTSANHGVSVGEWVEISGVWYRAVTGTTGTTLVIERNYTGITETVANANLNRAAVTGGTNNESTMMTAMRSDTGFDDFIVAQLHKDATAATYPYLSRMRAQKWANDIAGVYGTGGVVISVDDLAFRSGDNPHLSCTASITLAERVSAEQ